MSTKTFAFFITQLPALHSYLFPLTLIIIEHKSVVYKFIYCFSQKLEHYLMFNSHVTDVLLTLHVCEWVEMQTGKQGFPNSFQRKK